MFREESAEHGERACERLCTEFARCVDARDYGGFVALFAEDGVFDRGGEPAQRSQGRAEIHAFLAARPAGLVTRHVCANLTVQRSGPDEATGHSYCVVYRVMAEVGTPLPLPMPIPLVVAYVDRYRRTAEGWKIAHRRLEVAFQP